MRKAYLVIVSFLTSIFAVYLVLFIYTFFNFDNEFKHSLKSLEILNFHEKYSKKIHHLRDENFLTVLSEKAKVEDYLFTSLNKLDDKEMIVLFQGDSWMEMTNIHSSIKLLQNFKSKKKIGFINGGIGSYSPSLMNVQLDVLEEDFEIFPNIVVAYINQEDIGDEICRYKKNKVYKNGILNSVKQETDFRGPGWFNFSKIYGLSRIYLNENLKITKTFQLINFKFMYAVKRSSKRIYKKYISFYNKDEPKIEKCYWENVKKYFINPSKSDLNYFASTIEEYLKKMAEKKHIEKVFLVTFPLKEHFYKNSGQEITYEFNVSDVVDLVVENKKNVTHINFSKILLNDINFEYEDIWLEDNIHLKYDLFAKIFLQKILDELSKYLV